MKKTTNLVAQAALYIVAEPSTFDPHNFDTIEGQIILRTHECKDLQIGFRLNASGSVSFTGPDYPREDESLFVKAFFSGLLRMADDKAEVSNGL